MTVRATIYRSYDDRCFEPAKCLAFVEGDNWWTPPTVTGPELAQQLYGKQLAVDFLDWAEATGWTERLVDIVSAMPVEKGAVERAFIEFIAASAPKGARA